MLKATKEVLEILTADDRSYYSDEELAETPAETQARIRHEQAMRSVPKGTCWKCGKHIGKGIAKHVEACDG